MNATSRTDRRLWADLARTRAHRFQDGPQRLLIRRVLQIVAKQIGEDRVFGCALAELITYAPKLTAEQKVVAKSEADLLFMAQGEGKG